MVYENTLSISGIKERQKALLALEKAKRIKRKVVRASLGYSQDWQDFKEKIKEKMK